MYSVTVMVTIMSVNKIICITTKKCVDNIIITDTRYYRYMVHTNKTDLETRVIDSNDSNII